MQIRFIVQAVERVERLQPGSVKLAPPWATLTLQALEDGAAPVKIWVDASSQRLKLQYGEPERLVVQPGQVLVLTVSLEAAGEGPAGGE